MKLILSLLVVLVICYCIESIDVDVSINGQSCRYGICFKSPKHCHCPKNSVAVCEFPCCQCYILPTQTEPPITTDLTTKAATTTEKLPTTITTEPPTTTDLTTKVTTTTEKQPTTITTEPAPTTTDPNCKYGYCQNSTDNCDCPSGHSAFCDPPCCKCYVNPTIQTLPTTKVATTTEKRTTTITTEPPTTTDPNCEYGYCQYSTENCYCPSGYIPFCDAPCCDCVNFNTTQVTTTTQTSTITTEPTITPDIFCKYGYCLNGTDDCDCPSSYSAVCASICCTCYVNPTIQTLPTTQVATTTQTSTITAEPTTTTDIFCKYGYCLNGTDDCDCPSSYSAVCASICCTCYVNPTIQTLPTTQVATTTQTSTTKNPCKTKGTLIINTDRYLLLTLLIKPNSCVVIEKINN